MLCVIAKLDLKATQKLRKLQNVAASFGLRFSPVYGHITIATYTLDDDMKFIAGCKDLLQALGPFSVFFKKVEVLSETSIIVAMPQKNDVLISVHDRITAQYGAFLDQWTCDDTWYPHTTLVYNPRADLPRICRLMQDAFSPFVAFVKDIEFSRVTESGYSIVDKISLEEF